MLDAFVPVLTMPRRYPRGWFWSDLSAGVVLAAFLVPTGMGYAAASGLPVEYGLYASVAALTAYFLVGPSELLVVAPDSALAPLVAAALAAAPAAAAPGRAAVLALLAGAMCILAAVLRLGVLTDLISKPVRIGSLNGIALAVLVGQVPDITGMAEQVAPTAGDSVAADLAFIGDRLGAGDVSRSALAIGVGCVAVILGLRRMSPRAPGVLVAVVGAGMVVAWMRSRGIDPPALVPAVPAGLPRLVVPLVDWRGIVDLLPAAGAIALVAAADTSVLSRAFPGPRGVASPPNRELAALGIVNVAAGLLQGFPVSSSSTRTPVLAAAGAKSRLAGLIAAACVAVMIAFAPGLTGSIPRAALAAVVIAACASLLDVAGLVRLARVRPDECVVATICLLGVVVLGVLPGILLAVAVSLAQFVWRNWQPYDAVLGRVTGVKGYHDVARHPDARLIPGLVLFRWDAPLFFANAGIFRRRLLEAVDGADQPVRRVIVAAEPITDIDTTAADELCQIADELRARGIEWTFAELKGPVKDRLKRYGACARFGTAAFEPTLGTAVRAYLRDHDVAWQDWTD